MAPDDARGDMDREVDISVDYAECGGEANPYLARWFAAGEEAYAEMSAEIAALRDVLEVSRGVAEHSPRLTEAIARYDKLRNPD